MAFQGTGPAPGRGEHRKAAVASGKDEADDGNDDDNDADGGVDADADDAERFLSVS